MNEAQANEPVKGKPGEVITIVMCHSCKLWPGKPGWKGYFKKDPEGNWRHMDCPKPKWAEKAISRS